MPLRRASTTTLRRGMVSPRDGDRLAEPEDASVPNAPQYSAIQYRLATRSVVEVHATKSWCRNARAIARYVTGGWRTKVSYEARRRTARDRGDAHCHEDDEGRGGPRTYGYVVSSGHDSATGEAPDAHPVADRSEDGVADEEPDARPDPRCASVILVLAEHLIEPGAAGHQDKLDEDQIRPYRALISRRAVKMPD